MASIYTYVAAIAIAIHGIIHFLGIGTYFELVELADLPYKTTLLGGHLDVGDPGIRVFAVLTAAAGVGFVASALAVVIGWQRWQELLFAVTLFSLALTTLDWTVAYMGILANLAILAGLLVLPRT